MGDPRERNYQSLFSELAGYEKKGVYMLMNGVPASPMQIVQAHIVREDAVYMRDYVLNDNGDINDSIKYLRNFKLRILCFWLSYPQR